MQQQLIQHGVMLAVNNTGILLTGPSRIGKSELALGLIQRGHRLIADDYVILQVVKQKLMASCPPAAQGFLVIRDFGIINVKQLFGEQAVGQEIELSLIIKLMPLLEQSTIINNDAAPLKGFITMQTMLNVSVPEQTILVAPHRDLITLVEIAVKQQKLQRTGYDACADFLSRQQQFSNN